MRKFGREIREFAYDAIECWALMFLVSVAIVLSFAEAFIDGLDGAEPE